MEKTGDEVAKHDKWVDIQDTLWATYLKLVRSLRPIDVLIVNGDCIEGKNPRGGGTELITADRDEQVAMATYAIRMAEARKKVITYGTAYHAGTDEDWENQVAREVDADKIGAHEWVDVNGLIFDVKHHIGSSSIPHGRYTPIARDRLWNVLWQEYEEQPKAHILIRSHVHYFAYVGGENWLGITTPSLQGMGSKYGARRMSGHVDWGMLSFDVADKENWSWKWHIRRLKPQKAKLVKI
jgi:hypothetical protein